MPNTERVDRILEAIKGYAQYEYFFDRLDSPSWLEPLWERGLFRKPQPIEHVDNYIRFPYWPESRYLARMAQVPEAQPSVLKITRAIPVSDNSRVYDDLVEIALSLPPRSSAELVPQIIEGVQLPTKLLLKTKIGTLVAQLADGGQGEAALKLTEAALTLAPDPRVEGEDPPLRPRPMPLFEDFYYQRIAATAVPALANAVGLDSVRLFAGLLNDAIRLSQKTQDQEPAGEDFLYISHPAIEELTGRDDVPGVLLNALRDASLQLIASKPDELDAVLGVLAKYDWTSYQRLKLHLCRVFLTTGGLRLAEQAFETPEILNRGSLQREAVLLLKASFAQWPPASQGRVLDWVNRGFPQEAILRWLELSGQAATPENIQRTGDIWKRDHLAILAGQLPEREQRQLDELIATIGPARPLEEVRRITGGAFQALSPKAPEDFDQMRITDIFDFLSTWTPGTGLFEANAEGAGRNFAAAISKRLEDFVAAAAEFKRLDPTYVRALFTSATEALKRGDVFAWTPVLELAEWVSSKPREIAGRKGGLFVADPDWGWTRDAVIDLLVAGFDGELKGHLTYDLRSAVWTALRPLTDDPNPSIADEAATPAESASPVLRRFAQKSDQAEEKDLTTISINTTRGRAMRAIFNYARWVRQQTDSDRVSRGEALANLDDMSEVREVLDAHLDLSREPTRTIRSVYGDYLTLLAWLDWSWLEANLSRILPESDEDYAFFKAAWNNFVVFNWPNTSLFRVLVPSYRKAIQHLGKEPIPRFVVKSPEEALAEHLMVYYWLGVLDLEDDDQLLNDFYRSASSEVRGQAIWFIGTSVSGWDDEPPPEVYVRLQNLFERRMKAAAQAPSPDPWSSELSNFGFWFNSEKFDERWSIETLLASLWLVKKTAPDMDVVKRLSEIAPRYPEECVSCLRLMIEGDREGWMLVGVEEETRKLLKRALDSNHPNASMSAKRLIEELIAKGNFGFRTLLTT